MLIGPPAVGKMTVGQALEERLGYKLFHNHTTIEMVAPYFSYGSEAGRHLVKQLREAFLEAFAEDTGTGYIFTYVWAFGVSGEREYIEGLATKFSSKGHPVYLVELEATFDERLRRNRTENRLTHKPTKRDVAWSDDHLRDMDANHRLNSLPGEMAYDTYLRIDNTHRSAAEVAAQICDHFGLKPPDGA